MLITQMNWLDRYTKRNCFADYNIDLKVEILDVSSLFGSNDYFRVEFLSTCHKCQWEFDAGIRRPEQSIIQEK
jgi:hypothetical protein